MTGSWTVLVCGDPARGDDGAALAAAARLDGRAAGASIHPVGQLEPDDLVAALDRGSCIVLDVVRGIPPGALLDMPLSSVGGGRGPTSASSHALPLPTVVGIAAALGADLGRGRFMGIGGTSFDLGAGLGPRVEAGLDLLTRAVAARLEQEGGGPCA